MKNRNLNRSLNCRSLIAQKKRNIERQARELAAIIGANNVSVFCRFVRQNGKRVFQCDFDFSTFRNGEGS